MIIFTQVVRPSVPKLHDQVKITASMDSELAQWIIDDSCLIFLASERHGQTDVHHMWISYHYGITKGRPCGSKRISNDPLGQPTVRPIVRIAVLLCLFLKTGGWTDNTICEYREQN